MLPDDCPYNIGRITTFQSVSGIGYEASLREYGRKIGRVVTLNSTDICVDRFAHVDEVRFLSYASVLGLEPTDLAIALVNHFKWSKASKARGRGKFESRELRKLEKLLEKKECVYRLKGWEPGRWDFVGTKNLTSAWAFLDRMNPGMVETVVNRELLLSPDFKLPY